MQFFHRYTDGGLLTEATVTGRMLALSPDVMQKAKRVLPEEMRKEAFGQTVRLSRAVDRRMTGTFES